MPIYEIEILIWIYSITNIHVIQFILTEKINMNKSIQTFTLILFHRDFRLETLVYAKKGGNRKTWPKTDLKQHFHVILYFPFFFSYFIHFKTSDNFGTLLF